MQVETTVAIRDFSDNKASQGKGAKIAVGVGVGLLVCAAVGVGVYFGAVKSKSSSSDAYTPGPPPTATEAYARWSTAYPEKAADCAAGADSTDFQAKMKTVLGYYPTLNDNKQLDELVSVMTQFACISTDSFNTKFTNTKINTALRGELPMQERLVRAVSVPASIDWRTNPNALSPIKNQQQCGSCWAFSTADAVEAAYGLATNTKVQPLSVQQLVSCDPYDGGCNGGDPAQALSRYLAKTPLTSEKSYPYSDMRGQTSSCDSSRASMGSVSQLWSAVQVDDKQPVSYVTPRCQGGQCAWSSSAEQALMSALVKGPVSICIDASAWNNYAGGVVDGTGSDRGRTTCSGSPGVAASYSEVDHAVSLVGYTDKYWIVRNQWGTTWGEQGYIYLARGANTCCILCEAVQTNVKNVPTTNPTSSPTVPPATLPPVKPVTTQAPPTAAPTRTAAPGVTTKQPTAIATTQTPPVTQTPPSSLAACAIPAVIPDVTKGCYTSASLATSSAFADTYMCSSRADAAGAVPCCYAPNSWWGSVSIQTSSRSGVTQSVTCVYTGGPAPAPTTGGGATNPPTSAATTQSSGGQTIDGKCCSWNSAGTNVYACWVGYSCYNFGTKSYGSLSSCYAPPAGYTPAVNQYGNGC